MKTPTAADLRLEENCKALLAVMIDTYVRDRRERTIKEIAALCAWPESRVRKCIEHMLLSTVMHSKDIHIVMSRDYPMMQHQQRLVAVYAPNRRALAERISEMQRATDTRSTANCPYCATTCFVSRTEDGGSAVNCEKCHMVRHLNA
jgi:hypothetical protein